jgi:hypothetical protein
LSSFERSASFHVDYYQDSWGKEVMIYFVKVAVCLFENLKEGLAITLSRFRRSLLSELMKTCFHHSASNLRGAGDARRRRENHSQLSG